MNARQWISAAAAALAAASLLLLLGAFGAGSQALAATDDISAEGDELQARIEQATAEYDEAEARLAELESTIEANSARIAEIERILPAQRKAAHSASIALYKFNQEGFSLLNMLLNADSLSEIIKGAEYIDRVQAKYSAELAETMRLSEEVQAKQVELKAAWEELDGQKQAASTALAEATAAREERAAAAAAQAAAEAEELKAEEVTYVSDDGEEEGAVVTPTMEVVEISDDRATFVSQWAGRIDSYLSGSPLAGQGATFAGAAWDYGVDPRFSPAISTIESSKGAYCFCDHNAWGWGSVSWDSWEEAIDAHVRGLARGYGYTVTVEGAQKYCPPNWEFWYSRVSEEMNKI